MRRMLDSGFPREQGAVANTTPPGRCLPFTYMRPLRLMIYDRTCWGGRPPGLTGSWLVGGWLYRVLGRLDAFQGFSNWSDALEWLAQVHSDRPIAEIQYWGHGNWGNVRLGAERLDVRALRVGHPLHDRLVRVRERLTPNGTALWWFRTCETFGTEAGHQFAREWTRFFDARAAGHTHVIGPWQSGLHVLAPGQEPDWPVEEGLPGTKADAKARPTRALWSKRRCPNTITFLHGRIPPQFACGSGPNGPQAPDEQRTGRR